MFVSKLAKNQHGAAPKILLSGAIRHSEKKFYRIQKKLQTRMNTGLQHCSLASPTRFERATCRLGGDRSIQLSYGDIYKIVVILTLCGYERFTA